MARFARQPFTSTPWESFYFRKVSSILHKDCGEPKLFSFLSFFPPLEYLDFILYTFFRPWVLSVALYPCRIRVFVCWFVENLNWVPCGEAASTYRSMIADFAFLARRCRIHRVPFLKIRRFSATFLMHYGCEKVYRIFQNTRKSLITTNEVMF